MGITTFQHIVQAENVPLLDRVAKVFSPQKGILHNNLHEDYLVVLPTAGGWGKAWTNYKVQCKETSQYQATDKQTHTRYDADMNDHFCCRLGVDQYYTAQLIKRKWLFKVAIEAVLSINTITVLH